MVAFLNAIFEMGVAIWFLAFHGCQVIWLFYSGDVNTNKIVSTVCFKIWQSNDSWIIIHECIPFWELMYYWWSEKQSLSICVSVVKLHCAKDNVSIMSLLSPKINCMHHDITTVSFCRRAEYKKSRVLLLLGTTIRNATVYKLLHFSCEQKWGAVIESVITYFFNKMFWNCCYCFLITQNKCFFVCLFFNRHLKMHKKGYFRTRIVLL